MIEVPKILGLIRGVEVDATYSPMGFYDPVRVSISSPQKRVFIRWVAYEKMYVYNEKTMSLVLLGEVGEWPRVACTTCGELFSTTEKCRVHMNSVCSMYYRTLTACGENVYVHAHYMGKYMFVSKITSELQMAWKSSFGAGKNGARAPMCAAGTWINDS